jgi:DNA-binding beta-propeller fold protein YncE
MAGAHQIWQLDTRTRTIDRVAGTGAEEVYDASLGRAAFAQPTGLAPDGDTVYVADCESSAIREVDLGGGQVRTVVGTGLFDYGDRDGRGDDVRLQHCLDVAVHGDTLLVADTYNDKLKVVEPRSRTAVPFAGDAGEGHVLCEPGGVTVDGERVLVADTGNHRVVSVGFDGRVTPIEIVE